MISYCLAAYRPVYATLQIEDLIRKTQVPHEILVWVNTPDAAFLKYLEVQQKSKKLIIAGVTPENIGMLAFKHLFNRARYDIIVQTDDDVVRVSRNIPQIATDVFRRYPDLDQIVADVWQDAYTNGARPDMSVYKTISAKDGLFDGPMDGWFSMYRRSLLPVLMEAPYARYVYLGSWARGQILARRRLAALSAKMKVLHVIGPAYASLYGMLDFEIAKYHSLERPELAKIYEDARATLPSKAELEQGRMLAYSAIDRFGA